MPPKKKERKISSLPKFQKFKPAGIRSSLLEKVILSLDEYEAIRLADFEKLDHLAASEKMNISRPTFSRLIDEARNKFASALIQGKELVIKGGNISIEHINYRCKKCHKTFRFCDLNNKNEIQCPFCKNQDVSDLNCQFGEKKQKRCRHFRNQ